jgi:CheY-like chemotaxis protein
MPNCGRERAKVRAAVTEFSLVDVCPKEAAMFCVRENHCKLKASRLRVLVVEDDRIAAESLRELLESEGYAVRTVGCYKEAVKTACHWLPDVLVSDICLPDKNGREVVRCMQSAHPNLKAIAVSGCTAPEDVAQIYDAGFSVYLPKPLNADQLGATLRGLLAPT